MKKMVLAMAAAAMATAGAASGATVSIGTFAQLKAFVQGCATNYHAGDTVTLTADINCNGGSFAATSGTVFKGTFNGNGKKIYNFKNNGALFNVARDGAVIKNLTLEGTFYRSASLQDYAGSFAGKAIGKADGSYGLRLENCHFSGAVTNYANAGGLVGYAAYPTNAPGGKVLYATNCTVSGRVASDWLYTVGGLVALGEGVDAVDCTVEADLGGRWTMGGLFGKAVDSTATRCSFEGELGTGPGSANASDGGCGGLVGFASNSVFRACSSDADIAWNINTDPYDPDGRIDSYNFTADGGAAGVTCGSSAFYDCTAAGTLLAKHGYGGGFVGWTAGSEIFSNCVTEVTLQPDARYSNTHGHGGFASTVASDGALFVDCTTRSQGNNIVGGFFNNQHPRKGFTVGSNTFRRCHVENVPAMSAGFCSGAWNCTFEGCTVRGGTGDAGFVYSAGRQPDNQWNSNYSYEQTSTYTDCSVLGTRAPFGFVEWSNYSEKNGHTNIFRRCRAGCVYGKSNSSGASSAGFGSTLNMGTLIEDCAAYGIADMGPLNAGFAESISVGTTVRRCVGAVYHRNVDVAGGGFAEYIGYGTTVEDCYAVYAPYASAVNQSGDNGWRYGAQGGFVRRTSIGYNADDLPIARCFALWPLSKPNSNAEWISGAFCGVTPYNTSTHYFEDCYRPEESAIGDCKNADAEGVEALSLAEFATATAATMPNYDFANVWHAPATVGASSPYLDASVDENTNFWFFATVIGAEGKILINGEAPKEAYPAGAVLTVEAIADNPEMPFAGWIGDGFANPASRVTTYTVKNVGAIGARFCTPIYTVDDWTNMVHGIAGDSFSGAEAFALMNDLDFTDYIAKNGWDYVSPSRFYGKFFGQGHTIRGLVSTNGYFSNTRALFSKISNGAEIRDLTVESAVYPGSGIDNDYNTVCMAGLVCDVGSGSLISNCHTRVDCHGEFPPWAQEKAYSTSMYYGLARNVSGMDIRIVDCSVEGTMAGCSEVAGLVGYADLTGGEIARCSAMGHFSATNSRSSPHGRASGFAGEITLRNGATVRECFAAGVVEGAYYGSGFAHKISFTDDQSIVRDCYSTAEVVTREGGGINDYGNATGFAQRIDDNNDEGGVTIANCWFGGTARALSENGHSYGFAYYPDPYGDIAYENCKFVQSGNADEEMEGTAGVTAISKGARLSAGSWGGYDIGGAWTMEGGKTTPYFAWSLKDVGFRVFAKDETEGTSISHPETADRGTQAAVAGDTELALAVDTWLGAAGFADAHAPETTFLADNHRTLRCSWKEAAAPVSNVTQKVTFNGNGGTPATQKKTYRQNGKYDPLPGDPALADRVFGGWFTLPEGGTPITTNSTVTAVSNRTLYAHWKAYQNVTFDPNGGTCEPTDGRYEVGLAYGTLATAVREGYTLAGWFDAAEGGTQVTPAMTVAEPGAKTLHARWTANQYSVGLSRISGTGGTTNVMATFGSPMPQIKPPTGYTGHTFEGYWTERDGAGTKYYNGDGTSARDWDIAAATNLYGYWPGNRYTATFDKQGGTGGSSNAAVTYDQIVPAVTIPARTGYDFQGYFTEPNGKGTQYWRYNGQGDAYWMLTEDRTLYASWYAKFYSVSFDKQGGSGGWSNIGLAYGEMLPFMGELPTKDGCSFGGYWSEPNGGGVQYYAADGEPLRSWTTDGNGMLYAKWVLSVPQRGSYHDPDSAFWDVEFGEPGAALGHGAYAAAGGGTAIGCTTNAATGAKTWRVPGSEDPGILQRAVDQARAGDTILVAPGCYDPVVVGKDRISITSTGGRMRTFINGKYSARCVDFGATKNGKITGFTLVQGNAGEGDGGGIRGGSASYCLIEGCRAAHGGGAALSALSDCFVTWNTAGASGGGAYGGSLLRCEVRHNEAAIGGGAVATTATGTLLAGNEATTKAGGAEQSTLMACTVADNRAKSAAGVSGCTVKNSLLHGNRLRSGATNNYVSSTCQYTCAAPVPAGTGNFNALPNFVKGDENYHLNNYSKCRDKANKNLSKTPYDLAGLDRAMGSNADAGACEYATGVTPLDAADYDGDGLPDVGFFNPVNGTWFVKRTSDGTVWRLALGDSGSKLVPRDYDGDGVRDPAVYDSNTGTWKIRLSGTGSVVTKKLGWKGITLVDAADYDGDGKADPIIFNPASATWQILQSRNGATAVVKNFGTTGVKLFCGDYDGDGYADLAYYVAKNYRWYVRFHDGRTTWVTLGASGVRPCPVDLDMDGALDAGYFDPATGKWTVRSFVTRATSTVKFGDSTTTPHPYDWDNDGMPDTLGIYSPYRAGFLDLYKNADGSTTAYTINF